MDISEPRYQKVEGDHKKASVVLMNDIEPDNVQNKKMTTSLKNLWEGLGMTVNDK